MVSMLEKGQIKLVCTNGLSSDTLLFVMSLDKLQMDYRDSEEYYEKVYNIKDIICRIKIT